MLQPLGSSGVVGERVSLQRPQKAWGFQRAKRQSLENKLKKNHQPKCGGKEKPFPVW